MDTNMIGIGLKQREREGGKGTKLLSIVEKLRDVQDIPPGSLLEVSTGVDETDIVDPKTDSKIYENPDSFVRVSSEAVPETLPVANDCVVLKEMDGYCEENVTVTVLQSDVSDDNMAPDFTPKTAGLEGEDDPPGGEGSVPTHVTCTACGSSVKTLQGKLCRHPVLGVIVCKSCNKFYNSSSFKRDDNNMEEHCKWCGDGGEVIMCDFCEKVFCNNCIKRNMGKEFIKVLLDSSDLKWKCFACDLSQLETFKEECDMIMKIIQDVKLKNFAFGNKKKHVGPSQMVRKKRINCISHSIEDGVELPDDILVLEDDELDEDFCLESLQSKKLKNRNKSQKKTGRRPASENNRERKNTNGIQEDEKRVELDERVDELDGGNIDLDGGNTQRNMHEKREISPEELCLLKEKFSLKEFDIIIERIADFERYVTTIDEGSVNTTTISDREDNDGSERPVIESFVISDSGSAHEASGAESSMPTVAQIDEVSDVPPMENSLQTNSIDGASTDNSDVKSEDISGELAMDGSIAGSANELDSIVSDGNSASLHTDSDANNDSDSDAKIGYSRKTIRNAGKGKDIHTKSSDSNAGSSDSEAECEASDNGADDDNIDSDDSQNKLAKKVKSKKSKRKQARISDSDSDVTSRIKKRRRRRRTLSKRSSESDKNDDDLIISADEENEGMGSRTRGKTRQTKKSKRKTTTDKKKRKGRVVSSNSESSSDDDLSPSKKKGRKRIRRLLGDEELTEETQKARKLEEERRIRLLERTKAKYDEEKAVQAEEPGSRVVLERHKDSGEPLVQVHESLVGHLKPHQIEGIQFLYDCLFESVEKYKHGDKGSGALLAHCMGLGKTLQIITLIHTVMNDPLFAISRVLVVAPVNTVYNWEVEFEKWLEVDERIDVHVLADAGQNKRNRLTMLRSWFKNGGILIMGYDMYRNLTQFKRIKNKKQKKTITETLVDPGPELVVCDEGHILRNDLSAISKALSKIRTLRRVVLTGTPLQNNLSEYFVMVSFVKPNLLGTKKEFTNRFMNPILNGQCSDSTLADVKMMKQRCHVLYETLSGCVQRKDYSVLTPLLTPKHEYTIFVRLGERQRKMYQHYLDNFVCGNLSEIRARGSSLFADYQSLMKIWTHPWAIKLEAIRRMEKQAYDNIEDFLDDDESDEKSDEEKPNEKWNSNSDSSDFGRSRRGRNKIISDSSSESPDDKSSDEAPKARQNMQSKDSKPSMIRDKYPSRSSRGGNTMNNTTSQNNSSRTSKSGIAFDKDIFDAESSNSDAASNNSGAANDAEDIVVVNPSVEPLRGMGNTRSGTQFKEAAFPTDDIADEEKEWYDHFLEDGDDGNVELSGKLVLLMEVLANAEVVGDKVLVFSQSLVSLDLIEKVLGGGRIGGNDVNWFKGVDYFRLDGSTPAKTRQRYSDIFNDPNNSTARLFLISTRAGSLGVNLVAANRVIVFDCSWNPSHDMQSIFRVYRFGQVKPVYVYRFVTQGTMEEKIYERQITKLAMSGRVVDEQQIERHFTDEEMRELYTLAAEEYKEGEETATPQLPADPILAEVLQRQHPKWISKFQEHDLLLENNEDEKLTEEERKQAWDNYKAEKDNAARNVAREEDRLRLMRQLQMQQLQRQQEQYAQNLQQQQHIQNIQQQYQQQQLSRQRELEQLLRIRQQQQQQPQRQRLQARNIDNQIRNYQNAIQQMAQRMRAPNMANLNQVRHVQVMPQNVRVGNPEDNYRALQLANLAALRNSQDVPRWNVPAARPLGSNVVTLPGAAVVPRQGGRTVSVVNTVNIPGPIAPVIVNNSSNPPIVKTEIIELSP